MFRPFRPLFLRCKPLIQKSHIFSLWYIIHYHRAISIIYAKKEGKWISCWADIAWERGFNCATILKDNGLPNEWACCRHIQAQNSSGGQNDGFRPLTCTFGGRAWGAGTNMWHPDTPASYESVPAPLATQIHTLWIKTSGGSDIRSMSSIRPICKCRCPPLQNSNKQRQRERLWASFVKKYAFKKLHKNYHCCRDGCRDPDNIIRSASLPFG